MAITRSQTKQALYVRQCNTPVMTHLNQLKQQLSSPQKAKHKELCSEMKTQYCDSISTWKYPLLKKNSKFQETDRLVDLLHGKKPDLFKNAMHYMLNGAQKLVEQRKHVILMEAAEETDLEGEGEEYMYKKMEVQQRNVK